MMPQPRGPHTRVPDAVGIEENWSLTMRMRKKADLPQKICATCGLPFAWRKKWARDWDEVRYCSERCRGARKADKDSFTPGLTRT